MGREIFFEKIFRTQFKVFLFKIFFEPQFFSRSDIFLVLKVLDQKFYWFKKKFGTKIFFGQNVFRYKSYVVSIRPTSWNFVFVFFFVSFCIQFSRLLIGWFLAVVLTYRLFRILNPAIQELGWTMPHSDFLAWLSSATLKIFISGV